jgi:hypothetical protein
MISKRSLLLPLAALALGLGAASQSRAAIVVTLPTPTVAGSIVITNDLNFIATANGTMIGLVFDEWVLNDGSRNSFGGSAISGSLSYSVNGGAVATSGLSSFLDNHTVNSGTFTPNDGFVSQFTPISLTVGDVFTLKASGFTLAANSLPSGFNPQTQQVFTGNAFLLNTSFARFSDNTPVGGAVPEPGTAALGALAGLALVRRRRR